MSVSNPEQFTFIYKGIQYNATQYAHKHPGGFDFIENMRKQRKDFTQYFKCLHSEQAEKILKSFPIVSKGQPSKDSQQYIQIFKKVEHLFQPLWQCQIALSVTLFCTFLIACTTQYAILSTFLFGFTQMLCSWVGHSITHNRHPLLMKYGRIIPAIAGGFSLEWWGPKHNMHHIFTNSLLYDNDIKHTYKMYIYEFMFLKWRLDSFKSALKNFNYVQIFCIATNYSIILYNYQNIPYFFLGSLIAGFYTAIVLLGNHEREQIFDEKVKHSFIDHQIITCRNYEQTNFFWLMFMGGMQFQTQHHLFPQIPFYRLPDSVPIIKAELAKLKKTLIYGPVI